MLLYGNYSNNTEKKVNSSEKPKSDSYFNPAKNSIKQTISGTLEILTLFDLTMSLNGNKKSGKLNVSSPSCEATIYFKDGNIVHADYYGMDGETALTNIFVKTDGQQDAQFIFEAEEDLGYNLPKTIDLPFQELLFKVAVALDHHRK